MSSTKAECWATSHMFKYMWDSLALLTVGRTCLSIGEEFHHFMWQPELCSNCSKSSVLYTDKAYWDLVPLRAGEALGQDYNIELLHLDLAPFLGAGKATTTYCSFIFDRGKMVKYHAACFVATKVVWLRHLLGGFYSSTFRNSWLFALSRFFPGVLPFFPKAPPLISPMHSLSCTFRGPALLCGPLTYCGVY